MVSKIEPDRYADTGFSVKDTAPEVNALLFRRMMSREVGDRLCMGMDMTATAKALVWATLPDGWIGGQPFLSGSMASAALSRREPARPRLKLRQRLVAPRWRCAGQ